MKDTKLTSGENEVTFSIIVPMLNELEVLPELLDHLKSFAARDCEVLLVDGGSEDGSVDMAQTSGLKVMRCAKGRALQMNAGAQHSKGAVLVFLHADTRLPINSLQVISTGLEKSRWGRFDVRISGDHFMLRIVAALVNVRSRLTGIATGDQAIFMQRSLFVDIQGFPEQPLMEDIEISKRALQVERPACLGAKVTTSGRRWLQHGIWQTIWLMHKLRWAYWRGVPAKELVQRYYRAI